MKYPLKQLFLTPIVSLISLVIFFGCATYHTCPKLSDVPPGDSMPIDGVWKNCNGVLFRIERGRVYTTCELSNGLPANRVFIRDIRRISAGHYIGMEETYNSKKHLSAFGPNQIDIVSANRIRITTKPNPTTGYKGGEAFWEVHSLDDEQSYLKEFEKSDWEYAKKENRIKAYKLFIKKHPNSQYALLAKQKIKEIQTKAFNDRKQKILEAIEDIEIIVTKVPQTFPTNIITESGFKTFTHKTPKKGYSFVIIRLSLIPQHKFFINDHDVILNACGKKYYAATPVPSTFTTPPNLQPGDYGPWFFFYSSTAFFKSIGSHYISQYLFAIPTECIKRAKLWLIGKEYSVARWIHITAKIKEINNRSFFGMENGKLVQKGVTEKTETHWENPFFAYEKQKRKFVSTYKAEAGKAYRELEATLKALSIRLPFFKFTGSQYAEGEKKEASSIEKVFMSDSFETDMYFTTEEALAMKDKVWEAFEKGLNAAGHSDDDNNSVMNALWKKMGKELDAYPGPTQLTMIIMPGRIIETDPFQRQINAILGLDKNIQPLMFYKEQSIGWSETGIRKTVAQLAFMTDESEDGQIILNPAGTGLANVTGARLFNYVIDQHMLSQQQLNTEWTTSVLPQGLMEGKDVYQITKAERKFLSEKNSKKKELIDEQKQRLLDQQKEVSELPNADAQKGSIVKRKRIGKDEQLQEQIVRAKLIKGGFDKNGILHFRAIANKDDGSVSMDTQTDKASVYMVTAGGSINLELPIK